MELIDGDNLKDRIRRAAPLADEEIRSIGAAVAFLFARVHLGKTKIAKAKLPISDGE